MPWVNACRFRVKTYSKRTLCDTLLTAISPSSILPPTIMHGSVVFTNPMFVSSYHQSRMEESLFLFTIKLRSTSVSFVLSIFELQDRVMEVLNGRTETDDHSSRKCNELSGSRDQKDVTCPLIDRCFVAKRSFAQGGLRYATLKTMFSFKNKKEETELLTMHLNNLTHQSSQTVGTNKMCSFCICTPPSLGHDFQGMRIRHEEDLLHQCSPSYP